MINENKCIEIKCAYLKYDTEWREYYCEKLNYFIKDLDNKICKKLIKEK